MTHSKLLGLLFTSLSVLADASPRLATAEDKIEIVTNSIGLKLARIPAGAFRMGSPATEAERERRETLHDVAITKPFLIGIYEVTQAEYGQVMQGLADFRNRATLPSERNPVDDVEWQNAKRFCERLSARAEETAAGRRYRLPTEAEWEYACRAGTTTAFHCGDSLTSRQANFNGNYPAGAAEPGPYLRQTAKVGSYEPNTFGLYDMHGNLAEWCADYYDPEYYENSPQQDPLGPPSGVVHTDFQNSDDNFFRVVRGGCWVDDGRACRSAYRFRGMPNTQYRLIGFRVACDVVAPPKNKGN